MVLRFAIETFVWLYEGYLWTLTFADKRVENWLLMSSPKYTAYWTLFYLLMVTIGPLIMRLFHPIQCRLIMILYNGSMMLLNLYIFIKLFYLSWILNYSYRCQPVDFSDNPHEMAMAHVLWWFYFSKLLEFADTFFFIIRKKFNQLTFLHVYHHTTMFCFWWIGIKWVAGGSAFLGAMLNSFVHIIMYAYYGLTAAVPGRNFWWKKYLTVLQLIQFCIALVMAILGVRINCPFPTWMGYTLIGYMLSFIVLFGNFWAHAYCTRDRKKKTCSMDMNSQVKGLEPSTNGLLTSKLPEGRIVLRQRVAKRNKRWTDQ